MNQKGFSTNHERSTLALGLSQWRGMALYPRVLTQAEIDTVVAEFVKGGAVESFGSVADFFAAWRGCSSLTSFPLIDTSNGTSFRDAWRGCSSLENFPAGFFDNWTATPANNCLVDTWLNCTSLTATSVENILNSIDTSGRNPPASGVNITIDYNTATGTPDIATAVTNLKSRGWTITLNGVAQ
jgi:hypothetical protein